MRGRHPDPAGDGRPLRWSSATTTRAWASRARIGRRDQEGLSQAGAQVPPRRQQGSRRGSAHARVNTQYCPTRSAPPTTSWATAMAPGRSSSRRPTGARGSSSRATVAARRARRRSATSSRACSGVRAAGAARRAPHAWRRPPRAHPDRPVRRVRRRHARRSRCAVRASTTGRVVTDERVLNVRIPKGLAEGRRSPRRTGRRASAAARPDLYLEVQFRPDPRYRVQGRDV